MFMARERWSIDQGKGSEKKTVIYRDRGWGEKTNWGGEWFT
jgi:hypothetical protein